MALIKASEAPPKKAAPLPHSIESVINQNIMDGVRFWQLDDDWIPYKDDIADNANETGWVCKFYKAPTHDHEVVVEMIKFTPKP